MQLYSCINQRIQTKAAKKIIFFCQIKKLTYLCNAFKEYSNAHLKKQIGPVVQLVRIHACHAWGRGFESRPDRLNKRLIVNTVNLFLFCSR